MPSWQQDPYARVACETLLTTGLVCLAGEITTKALIDYPSIVRQIVREIGYTSSDMGFDAATCAVMVALGKQSPDIAQGVDEDSARGKDIGAGDQGMMFGFACNETPELMPLPIAPRASDHQSNHRVAEKRNNQVAAPDSKSQVTVEYEGYTPVRIDTVVVSTQHHPDVTHAEIVDRIKKEVIEPVLPSELVDGSITFHINPTGKFVIGGPHGDSGVTGRKIIVDTYGGTGRHGGGAFSGKDPTKVDRSAAYMARYVAKNVVASGLAERCEIQLAYAIGVSEPVSVHVDTQGTGTLPDSLIAEARAPDLPLESLRHHQTARPPPADLPQDRQRRPFRPQRARVHLGKDRQGPAPSRSRQHLRTVDLGLNALCHRFARKLRLSRPAAAFRTAVRRRARGDGVLRPGGSSFWEITPTTTAAWSSPPPSTVRPSSSAASPGRLARVASAPFRRARYVLARRHRADRTRGVDPIRARSLLGPYRVLRSACFAASKPSSPATCPWVQVSPARRACKRHARCS